MMDKRPIVLAESIDVDFATNRWQFAPLGNFAVGAGQYLIVPFDAKASWADELRANIYHYLEQKRSANEAPGEQQ